MKALLICPAERPTVPFLSESSPLSQLPLLGQSLLEYWLSHLAAANVEQVLVLTHEQAPALRSLLGQGERWGLSVTVAAESRELTPAQALLKYAPQLDPLPMHSGIAVLDHFPGQPQLPLFRSYADWFAALHQWMPQAMTADRVGYRQIRPGVWVGHRCHVSPHARLEAPCWVGKNVYVGAQAVVGPHTIVEDSAFIDRGSQLSQSWVGPHTYVGPSTQLRRSVAWANRLLNWQTESRTQVPDPFLLCALREPQQRKTSGWLAHLGEMFARNKDEVALLWKHLLMHKQG